MGCAEDARICPDGNVVGYSRDCEFSGGPVLQYCGVNKPCDDDKKCYNFINIDNEIIENEMPYCFEGEPCIKCPSGDCTVIETFPLQIECN